MRPVALQATRFGIERQVGGFARAAGAVVSEPRLGPTDVRSLEPIAVENAMEGCVRETFGAAIAAVQSLRAIAVSARP